MILDKNGPFFALLTLKNIEFNDFSRVINQISRGHYNLGERTLPISDLRSMILFVSLGLQLRNRDVLAQLTLVSECTYSWHVRTTRYSKVKRALHCIYSRHAGDVFDLCSLRVYLICCLSAGKTATVIRELRYTVAVLPLWFEFEAPVALKVLW